MRGELLLLSTRSMTDFASRVAFHLASFSEFFRESGQEDFVGRMRCTKFADGEMEVEVLQSLRGRDVFLISGAGRNSQGLTNDENKIELYNSIDAIKRSDAGHITLFEPYYSSSRSDRTTRRNSVGFWVHYKTCMSLGVNHILTYQLHSDKSKTAVDPTLCSIDDVPAVRLLQEYIAEKFVRTMAFLDEQVKNDWLFCSVDAGGESLARHYAKAFHCQMIIAHKQRNYKIANTIDSIHILSDTKLEGKEVWIVDDMIDTAGSVDALVRELKHRGVAHINIAIVHAVFSDPATKRLQDLYQAGMLNALVVTDTIEITEELRLRMPFLRIVSACRLSAEIIKRIHEHESLSSLLDSFDAANYFESLKRFF